MTVKMRKILRPGAELLSSPEAWQKHWMNYNPLVPYFGEGKEVIHGYEWIMGREIRVYRFNQISDRTLDQVLLGISSMVSDVGLDIKVRVPSPHLGLSMALNKSLVEGRIDYVKLAKSFVNHDLANYGQPYANIVVTDKLLSDTGVPWGRARFDYGCAVLSLAANRSDYPEIVRRFSKHETGHLLGIWLHHGDGDSSAYVQGYNHPKQCSNDGGAGTLVTCRACRDMLTYMWKGIETRTNKSFFCK